MFDFNPFSERLFFTWSIRNLSWMAKPNFFRLRLVAGAYSVTTDFPTFISGRPIIVGWGKMHHYWCTSMGILIISDGGEWLPVVAYLFTFFLFIYIFISVSWGEHFGHIWIFEFCPPNLYRQQKTLTHLTSNYKFYIVNGSLKFLTIQLQCLLSNEQPL